MSTFAFSRNVSCPSMVKSLRPHAGEISRLWLVNGHWSWPLIGWWGGAWGDPHRDNCKKWHWQICMQRHASPESSSGLTNGMKNSMIHLLQYISPEVTFRWKYCLNIAEHCTDVYVWDSHLFSLLDVSSEEVCLSVQSRHPLSSVCPCLFSGSQ